MIFLLGYICHFTFQKQVFFLQKVKLNEKKENLFYFLKSIRTGTISRCSNRDPNKLRASLDVLNIYTQF